MSKKVSVKVWNPPEVATNNPKETATLKWQIATMVANKLDLKPEAVDVSVMNQLLACRDKGRKGVYDKYPLLVETDSVEIEQIVAWALEQRYGVPKVAGYVIPVYNPWVAFWKIASNMLSYVPVGWQQPLYLR